jgi:hypothetical protein
MWHCIPARGCIMSYLWPNTLCMNGHYMSKHQHCEGRKTKGLQLAFKHVVNVQSFIALVLNPGPGDPKECTFLFFALALHTLFKSSKPYNALIISISFLELGQKLKCALLWVPSTKCGNQSFMGRCLAYNLEVGTFNCDMTLMSSSMRWKLLFGWKIILYKWLIYIQCH